MAWPALEEQRASVADNTENIKSDDLTEEDDFSPEQSKEPVGSTQTWCSGVRSLLMISEFFNIAEHQLKQQGEVTIESTTENYDLMITELHDSGKVTIENTTQNDDLMMKEFTDSEEFTIENTNDNDDLMMTEADDSGHYWPKWRKVTIENTMKEFTDYGHYRAIWDILRQNRLNVLRVNTLYDVLRVNTLYDSPFVKYSPLILSRRTLFERHQLSDNSNNLAVPRKDTWDTWFGYPLNPARNQIVNSSKGDRNIEDNVLSTDQAQEKSQKTITERKYNTFPMKSQYKDANGIIHKLKDIFFLMSEMTWILCVLIATSQVVVAETALTKTLSVPVSSDIELCGLTCDKSGMYTLDRDVGVPILDYFCPEKSISFHDWNRERLQVNVSTGCCIIKNALKSDTGNYELVFQGTKKEIWVQTTSCLVIDPISGCIITTKYSDSGEILCLSVSYSGEEATVLWTWNGGALPERHQLSDSNKTLTVPSTDTGTFTVLVSNPVSYTSTEYIIPSFESRSRMGIGLCAAVAMVTGMTIIALKGPARKTFERMKQNNTANKSSATANTLMSQPSCMVSVDGTTKEQSDMFV